MTYSPRLSFVLRSLRSRLRLSASRRSSLMTLILMNAIKAAKAMMNMPNFQTMESAASKSSFINTPSEKKKLCGLKVKEARK